MSNHAIGIIQFFGLFFWLPLMAEEPTVLETSLFSVITQKGGVAKGLAHNHFIHAPKYEASLRLDPDQLESARLDITISVADLEIAPLETAEKWFAKIKDLAILDEAFSEQSAKNLKKVKKSMFGSDQLNLKKFTEIRAEILEIHAKPTQIGTVSFTHEIKANITIIGRTVPGNFAANLSYENDLFQLEALTSLNFSDFGIKPYSAFFGAISVLDPFHIYIQLQAR